MWATDLPLWVKAAEICEVLRPCPQTPKVFFHIQQIPTSNWILWTVLKIHILLGEESVMHDWQESLQFKLWTPWNASQCFTYSYDNNYLMFEPNMSSGDNAIIQDTVPDSKYKSLWCQ